jgi:hypothetical protein
MDWIDERVKNAEQALTLRNFSLIEGEMVLTGVKGRIEENAG